MASEGTTYEDLALIELDFEDVENEIIAKNYILSQPIFHRRATAIAGIPNYWALVFEQAPPDIDSCIQPSDSEVLASCLTSLQVDRPEIPKLAKVETVGVEHYGEPRTLSFRFEFSENEWFEDKVLEKTFYWRRGKDGYLGRVSDPVKINWKKGKDLTDGLTDAAVALWHAQKKAGNQLDGPYEGDALKTRDAAVEALPEYQKLKTMLEKSPEGSQSFFTWFAYRGRWISASESEAAVKEASEKRKAGKTTEPDEDEDKEEEELDDLNYVEADVEVYPGGEELAMCIGEDLYPSANRYFMASQEEQDDDMEDAFDSDDDDEEGEEMTMEDIKALVGKRGDGPPSSKKQKR